MDFLPILNTMRRNKIGVLLIAMQIAITLAVVSNAFHIISQRTEQISRPSGLNEEDTFFVITKVFAQDADIRQIKRDDLEAIKNLEGVSAVTTIQSIPLSGGGWGEDFYITPEQPSNETANFGNFMTDENGVDALGLEIIAGRNFTAEEVQYQQELSPVYPPVVIISEALANEMFPDGDALGKFVYDEPEADTTQIIGIYKQMQGAWPTWRFAEQSAIMPMIGNTDDVRYFIRAEPGMKDQAMASVEAYLSKPDRVVRVARDMQAARERIYSGDIAMVKLLTGVALLLATITGLGIVGLAWFSVTQRRKQIGTRRALGATKRDVIRYFLTENWMITTLGLIIGVVLSLLLNYALDTNFQTGKLNWIYIPLGMVCLWVLGWLAVFAPARRAANVPPAIATRNV